MAGLLDLMAPDPNIVRRGTLIPYGYDKTGRGQMTYPGLLIDAAKSFDNLGTAMRLPANAPVTHPAYKSVFDAAGTISLPSLLSPARPSSTVGMNLYHGGPNKWEAEPGFPQGRPRLDKIGAGEGNAAKGQGFYAAQEPVVANSYKEMLSPIAPTMTYGGRPIPRGVTINETTRRGTDFTPQEGMANNIYNEAISESLDPTVVIQNKINSTLRRKNNLVELAKAEGREGRSQHIVEVQNLDNHIGLLQSIDPKLMRKAGPDDKVPEGQLYKIEIPDEDIAKYIDLDAPLSEQSQHIKNALEKIKDQLPENAFDDLGGNWDAMFGPNVTGEQLMGTIDSIMGGDFAAEVFRKAGIPGNRYSDGLSRGRDKKVTVMGEDIGKYANENIASNFLILSDGNFKKAINELTKDIAKKELQKLDTSDQTSAKKLLQNWADEPGAIDIVDGRTRNYVTWDQDVLDRVKVLQRNKNKYQQEINSGVPFI
tara:strand:+ start:4241 stop:5683 length:1443 start_codon:yes stop_codon:yes gene_type:complete